MPKQYIFHPTSEWSAGKNKPLMPSDNDFTPVCLKSMRFTIENKILYIYENDTRYTGTLRYSTHDHDPNHYLNNDLVASFQITSTTMVPNEFNIYKDGSATYSQLGSGLPLLHVLKGYVD